MRTSPSLTTLSRTGGLVPDLRVLTGRQPDLDLGDRAPLDSPDVRHEITDQKGAELQGGAAAPDPACMAPVAPLFHPLPSYADTAGSSLHQRGRTPHPGKPFCKRDTAEAAETREMRATVDDHLPDARRGQMARQRPTETPETAA